MTWHERELRSVELSVDDVQIGPADPARTNTQQHLAVSGGRIGKRCETKRRQGRVEHHRAHGRTIDSVIA
jgi:hypothetical protein